MTWHVTAPATMLVTRHDTAPAGASDVARHLPLSTMVVGVCGTYSSENGASDNGVCGTGASDWCVVCAYYRC